MKDALLKTREILALPEHWTQNSYGHHGCYCIMGALGKALDIHAILLWSNPATIALQQATSIPKRLGEDADTLLFVWNDAAERTHQDVLDLIDKALETAS